MHEYEQFCYRATGDAESKSSFCPPGARSRVAEADLSSMQGAVRDHVVDVPAQNGESARCGTKVHVDSREAYVEQGEAASGTGSPVVWGDRTGHCLTATPGGGVTSPARR